jgi:ataxia telangiectasia mutated family protein
LEQPTDILEKYFSPAAELVRAQDADVPSDATLGHASVYYQFAVFAERQYHAILKSPDTLRYRLYMDRKSKELHKQKAELGKVTQGTQSHRAALRVYQKTESDFRQDREQLAKHTKVKDTFREQALEMFSRCMATADALDDESIMRFCSLWFSDFDEAEIYGVLKPAVDRVPSRKFVTLAHQLSARLSNGDDAAPLPGQAVLKSLILRMCREHPFHSLYQVYCLRPAHDHAASQGRRQSGRVDHSASQAGREAAASDIFAILREDPQERGRVVAVEQLCDASLQWAKHPIKKEFATQRKKGPYTVPESLLIRKLHNLRVPITTAHTPLDPTMRYDNCVWLVRYEPEFETAGGINLPKISCCKGSDGLTYKQLVGALCCCVSFVTLTRIDAV